MLVQRAVTAIAADNKVVRFDASVLPDAPQGLLQGAGSGARRPFCQARDLSRPLIWSSKSLIQIIQANRKEPHVIRILLSGAAALAASISFGFAEEPRAKLVAVDDRKAVIATVEPVREFLARARIPGTITALTFSSSVVAGAIATGQVTRESFKYPFQNERGAIEDPLRMRGSNAVIRKWFLRPPTF
jgi:hypothetical protein